MKIYFLILYSLFSPNIFGQPYKSNINEFNLTGIIKGNSDSIIILRYVNYEGKFSKDTSIIRNGRFNFSGTIKGATLARISCQTLSNSVDDPNFVEIYLEPNSMEVELEINNFKEAIVLGSKTQNEWNAFRIMQKPLTGKADSIYSLIVYKTGQIENISNQTEKKIVEKEINDLQRELTFQNKIRKNIEIKFINENPGSSVSAELLFYCATDLSFDSLNLLYKNFTPHVLESRSGENATQLINKMSNSEVGAKAPDFDIINLNGDTIRLSNYFQKKAVLLEFWASWCQPCRASFPQIKEIQTEYNNSKLEIIAISRDLDEKAWRGAIKKDAIENWEHCSVFEDYRKDEKGMFILNEIEHKYYIPGIPLTILIDKTGIVTGYYFGKSNENYENLKNKLSNLMKDL